MADVMDVAEAILSEHGPMDTYRLQKLVYYAQAYHLAKHGTPLFSDPIEGWRRGPVVRRLFKRSQGNYRATTVGGSPGNLSAGHRDAIDKALMFYGHHDAQWLVAQTHVEKPWIESRRGLGPKDPGSTPISPEMMRKYYAPIFNDPEVEAALESLQDDRGEGLTAEEFTRRYSA